MIIFVDLVDVPVSNIRRRTSYVDIYIEHDGVNLHLSSDSTRQSIADHESILLIRAPHNLISYRACQPGTYSPSRRRQVTVTASLGNLEILRPTRLALAQRAPVLRD